MEAIHSMADDFCRTRGTEHHRHRPGRHGLHHRDSEHVRNDPDAIVGPHRNHRRANKSMPGRACLRRPIVEHSDAHPPAVPRLLAARPKAYSRFDASAPPTNVSRQSSTPAVACVMSANPRRRSTCFLQWPNFGSKNRRSKQWNGPSSRASPRVAREDGRRHFPRSTGFESTWRCTPSWP